MAVRVFDGLICWFLVFCRLVFAGIPFSAVTKNPEEGLELRDFLFSDNPFKI
jgi:hypothetical protein